MYLAIRRRTRPLPDILLREVHKSKDAFRVTELRGFDRDTNTERSGLDSILIQGNADTLTQGPESSRVIVHPN